MAWCSLIQFEPCSPFDAIRADAPWGLAALNEEMRVLIKKIRDSRKRMAQFDPRVALVIKMELGAAAVGLLARDPKLPGALLPRGWRGDTLRRDFALWNVEITERARRFWEPVLDPSGRR